VCPIPFLGMQMLCSTLQEYCRMLSTHKADAASHLPCFREYLRRGGGAPIAGPVEMPKAARQSSYLINAEPSVRHLTLHAGPCTVARHLYSGGGGSGLTLSAYAMELTAVPAAGVCACCHGAMTGS